MVKNRIRARRAALDISQAKLAAQLKDVKYVTVFSSIERGCAMPTREDLGIMCGMLKCAPEDLYDTKELDLAFAASKGVEAAGKEKAGADAATSNSRQANNSKVIVAHSGANVKGVRA